ncbi:MAG: hypothetical protein FH762_18585 [Firmicutes bacterium]|nr:hypothetical protein [Bacillota bacterium]
MGYVFEGRYNRGAPRDTNYTFVIRAKDENGNYSEPSKITVQHPGIQQLVLEEQDVQGLIASIKINLPKAFSEISQTVYPYDETSEEKDILGYRLFIQEVDEYNNPVGIEEIINYDIEELENRIIYYQAETGKRFKVRVGAYDSVCHYDWNSALFEQTISEPIYVETFKIRFIDIDESLISPNNLTETLRNSGVPVYELEDKYTWIVGKNVDGEDIIGGIGLEVNEAEKKVDVQFVADSFRLFPTDENGDIIEGEDKAVFAVDTTPEGSTIFMDANQIGIRASKDDGSGEYNFFVLDGEGLEIFTENFKLDKNGNTLFSGEIKSEQFSLISDVVKINNDGITVTGDGFYSKLDDQGLYLYKEGENDPYWYCKNVASGIAQDGDYIELNWSRKPKVITSLHKMYTYSPEYADKTIYHSSGYKNLSAQGFNVTGGLIAEGAYAKNDMGSNLRYSMHQLDGDEYFKRTGTLTSEYCKRDSTIRLDFDLTNSGIHTGNDSDGYQFELYWKVYYRKIGETRKLYNSYNIAVIYFNKYYYRMFDNYIKITGQEYFTDKIIKSGSNSITWRAVVGEHEENTHSIVPISIRNLPRGIYRIEIDFDYFVSYARFTRSTDIYSYLNVKNIKSYGDEIIKPGTISWLAIDGGVE